MTPWNPCRGPGWRVWLPVSGFLCQHPCPVGGGGRGSAAPGRGQGLARTGLVRAWPRPGKGYIWGLGALLWFRWGSEGSRGRAGGTPSSPVMSHLGKLETERAVVTFPEVPLCCSWAVRAQVTGYDSQSTRLTS